MTAAGNNAIIILSAAPEPGDKTQSKGLKMALTLRLDTETQKNLDLFKEKNNFLTASKAIFFMIDNYEKSQELISDLKNDNRLLSGKLMEIDDLLEKKENLDKQINHLVNSGYLRP